MEEDFQFNFESTQPVVQTTSQSDESKKINHKAQNRKSKYQNKYLKKGKQEQYQGIGRSMNKAFEQSQSNFSRNNNNSNSNYNQQQSHQHAKRGGLSSLMKTTENQEPKHKYEKSENYNQKNQQQQQHKSGDLDDEMIRKLQNQDSDDDDDDEDAFFGKKGRKGNAGGEHVVDLEMEEQMQKRMKNEEKEQENKKNVKIGKNNKEYQKMNKKSERSMDKFVQRLSKNKDQENPNFRKQEQEKGDEMQEENQDNEGKIFQMEQIADNIKTETFTAKKFEEIPDLNRKMASALKENSFETLTNIQSLSYNPVFSGANVAVKSETGSGKTLAYLVPLLNKLLNQTNKVERAQGSLIIIISPTRELSIQCMDVAQKLLHWANNIICGGLVGGENPQKEKAKIRKGISILFATPGRLLYHLKNTESFKCENMQTVVFEESDRTLDMGFKKDLEEIIKILNEKIEFEKVQKILISAHFSEQIEKLYLQMSDKPIEYVGFSKKQKQEAKKKGKKNETEEEVQNDFELEEEDDEDNLYIQIDKNVKVPKTLKQYYTVVHEDCRVQFLITYLHKLQNTKTIVFLSTCSQVEYFEMIFNDLMYKNQNGEQTEERILKDLEVYKLHGNIDQKERTETYFKFKKTPSGAVLFSTDVAARGLDFPEVTHTVLFEIPPSLVDYCNRIGRTARIDKKGVSLLVLNKPEEEFADKLKNQGLDISLFESKMIFENFSKHLKREHQIGMFAEVYIEGLLKSIIKYNKEKQALARSAYISSIRAYARLTDRTIFKVKALNLKGISKSYGLLTVKSKDKDTKTDEYVERLEKVHKNKLLQDKLMTKFSKKQPRQALNIKKTMMSEFV